MKTFCNVASLGLLLLFKFCFVTCQNSSYAGLNSIEFENSMLNSINSIRGQHGNTPYLRLENDLTASAQAYADRLAASNSGVSRDDSVLQVCGGTLKSEYQVDIALNSGSNRCGESLAVATGKDLTKDCNPDIFAQIWNAQRLYYNYTFPPNNSMIVNRFADFTQLIWRNSQFLGVGVATNIERNRCFVVARYWPEGNLIGEYDQNVVSGAINLLRSRHYVITFITIWVSILGYKLVIEKCQ